MVGVGYFCGRLFEDGGILVVSGASVSRVAGVARERGTFLYILLLFFCLVLELRARQCLNGSTHLHLRNSVLVIISFQASDNHQQRHDLKDLLLL